ncbi:hypothetical protein KKB55_15075 [Myxococcota bacterium]|nr:hypothetical protein [Myxococcota bacterium]MBU1899061.1 hypothetical protein [Myxococcota bacterium]
MMTPRQHPLTRRLTSALAGAALAASMSLGCSGEEQGTTTPTNTAKTRQMKGALKNAEPGTKVGARTSDGKTVAGTVDEASGNFNIELPEGVEAVLSIKEGDQLIKVGFARAESAYAEAQSLAAAWGFEIPDLPFGLADLGVIDLNDVVDGVLIIGDEDGEGSIWASIDTDGDGTADFFDDDDDDDGLSDGEDADWEEDVEAWLNGAGGWDVYEEAMAMAGCVEACEDDAACISACVGNAELEGLGAGDLALAECVQACGDDDQCVTGCAGMSAETPLSACVETCDEDAECILECVEVSDTADLSQAELDLSQCVLACDEDEACITACAGGDDEAGEGMAACVEACDGDAMCISACAE